MKGIFGMTKGQMGGVMALLIFAIMAVGVLLPITINVVGNIGATTATNESFSGTASTLSTLTHTPVNSVSVVRTNKSGTWITYPTANYTVTTSGITPLQTASYQADYVYNAMANSTTGILIAIVPVLVAVFIIIGIAAFLG